MKKNKDSFRFNKEEPVILGSAHTKGYWFFMKSVLDSKDKDVAKIVQENENELIKRAVNETVRQFIEQKNKKNIEVIRESNLTKDYFYAIYSGKRLPGRDKTLQLAFGLGLNVEETNLLLKTAGHNELYGRNKRDLIVMICINTNKTLSETDDTLYEADFDPLTPE